MSTKIARRSTPLTLSSEIPDTSSGGNRLPPPSAPKQEPKAVLEKVKEQPPLPETPVEPAKKFEKAPTMTAYGLGSSCNPFEEGQPGELDVIFPWLKRGDIVLVTGYSRNCGFIEKLSVSLVENKAFFGFPNFIRNSIVNNFLWDPAENIQLMCSNVKFDLRISKDKETFLRIASEVKRSGKVLVYSFEYDYDFLRKMKCWDSIIEIRRGIRIKSDDGNFTAHNLCFLRCNNLPEYERIKKHKMIIHIPRKKNGFDATRNIHFIEYKNGYEELKAEISQLFYLGRSSKEIKRILDDESKIVISLPMLNKLKVEWGLRTYRPETKPRKRKRTKKPYVPYRPIR